MHFGCHSYSDQLVRLKKELHNRSADLSDHERQACDQQQKCRELTSQLAVCQKMLQASQATEQDVKRQLELLGGQKGRQVEKMGAMQQQVERLQRQLQEQTGFAIKLERELNNTKRQYKEVGLRLEIKRKNQEMGRYFCLQLEKEKKKSDEYLKQMNGERSSMDKAISAIERENADLQNSVQQLQVQLARLEQHHAQK